MHALLGRWAIHINQTYQGTIFYMRLPCEKCLVFDQYCLKGKLILCQRSRPA
jgi:hypothetical protein